MSEAVVPRPVEAYGGRARRGQSLVEFALILPLLMVLFLGIADFGRAFSAGITIEAAARNAAEIVAEEYRRNPPAPLNEPAPPGDSAYYGPLHDLGASTVCSEMRSLANTTYDAGTRRCQVADGDPDTPDWMPVILVCIHDAQDPLCSTAAYGASIPNPECSQLLSPISPALEGGTEDSRYVEVRVCYLFTMAADVPLLSLGEFWLQRDRSFTVADYPVPTPTIPPQPSAPPPTSLPTPSPTAEPTPTPEATPSDTAQPTPTPAPTPACTLPVASFTAVPTTGKRPLTVAFTDTSTSPNCPILSYQWNFGDGGLSTQQNPSHTFTFNGNGPVNRTVTHTVTNAAGTSAPVTTVITVTK
jgi:hypothetical protein